ncbi:MAG: hypothetical protein Q6373_008940 [Candidatus Sigynarchaeota archaeon]
MAEVVLQTLAFFGGFALIILGVDWFMDNAKELIEKRRLSPYLLGAISFGIDVEEIIASIAAAILGYPTVAVGNAIGNNTIALTIPLAIPGFFLAYRVKKVPRPFIITIVGQLLVIVVSIYSKASFGLSFSFLGIATIALYACLLAYNAWFVRKMTVTTPTGDLDKILDGHVELENEDPDGDPVESRESQPASEAVATNRKVLMMVVAAIMVSTGAWVLGDGLQGVIDGLGISQHVVGYVIVALGVNAEEFVIAFKSARRKIPEVGIGSLLMKTACNLGLTYGISVIVDGNVPIAPSLAWNLALLVVAFVSIMMILRNGKMNCVSSTAMTVLFSAAMLVNLLVLQA